MIEVKDVKNSLRLDHSLDDEMLQSLIVTASDYIISAVDSKAKEG